MIRYVLISALLVVAVYSFTIEDENEDTFLEEAKEELDPEEERRIALPPGAVCNGHKSDCQCFGAKYKCSCPWLWRFRRSAECYLSNTLTNESCNMISSTAPLVSVSAGSLLDGGPGPPLLQWHLADLLNRQSHGQLHLYLAPKHWQSLCDRCTRRWEARQSFFLLQDLAPLLLPLRMCLHSRLQS
uniref:U33-Lycotoxin-Lsp1c_1 n=1 Tax=Lycosa sp. SGP-2016 TaxID=1905177 RepID=A0A482Z971_9ARAC